MSLVVGPARDDDVPALADLLVACVQDGASVGPLAGLTQQEAVRFWQAHLARHGHHVLVARGPEVLGTVTLVPADAPNGRHRAEVRKLLVRPDARRRGVARALLRALEQAALADGRDLLLLDTETGSAAQRLYEADGWQVVGVVDDHAARPDGVLAPTTFLSKRLLRG